MSTDKRILAVCAAILFFVSAPPCFAAINANTVWECRTDGAQTNGGGFQWLSLVSATYKWTASGSGTNEYYCEAAAGGDPSLTEAKCCSLNGAFMLATNGTLGSLNAGEWDWGDNDTLGYSTVYVRLADGADPDMKAPGYVQIGYGGGYDYSQQAAAQLALTDGYSHNDTGLHSDTGGFTALMVGNVIRVVSGTSTTAGWYQITAYVSGNEVTLDRAAVTGDNSANKDMVLNVGGAFLIGGTLDDEFVTAAVAGNTTYVKSGTYTLGEEATSTISGTVTNPISVIGYDADRATVPTGDNRPLLACGAVYFGASGTYHKYSHLRFTGTGSYVLYAGGTYATVVNCKATNSSGIANRSAFHSSSTGSCAIGCEGISANGYAFNLFQAVSACYAHDSSRGFNGIEAVVNSVADTCTTSGISGSPPFFVLHCTIYNCGIGVNPTGTQYPVGIINTIIDACTTGIDAAASLGDLVVAYCCLDNTTNFGATVTKRMEIGNRFGDPGMADPANGDFRITSADSNVYELGLDVQVYTGAVVR